MAEEVVAMAGFSGNWLARPRTDHATDDAGGVLRAWRKRHRYTQEHVAELLGTTQQHLSQMEKGTRALSLEQRRQLVAELGIAPEELGLSSGQSRFLVSSEDESPEIATSRAQWRAERCWLNRNRAGLARLAVDLYSAEHRIPRAPLIAAPDWVPREPVPLRSVALSLDETESPCAVDGSEPESAGARPLRIRDARFEYYTSAIKHLDRPALFESRPSYRLLGGSPANGNLSFGLAAYFDKLDVSEALGHEVAAVCMDDSAALAAPGRALRGRLPFRDLIGDPFDPFRRAIIPAITTLTIRLHRYPVEPSFLLHWRDPSRVATAGGLYDVVPAGEFQPSSVALWDRRNDFDLWRNIVREYSEELLGTPEHDGTRSKAIDYDSWSLYRTFEQCLAAGTASAHVLGVGLDALTLAATILTVVVLDDDAFRQAFESVVRYNEEGEIVGVGQDVAEGVPFTAESIERMLSEEPLASPGAACLSLAWQHREVLLGL
ncbi:helix-turn-helix transcriptional regulator [Pseudonocardia sp. C8]|uniref:helix-turn-helix domain-containing protein n=1 Tax=Pseudonocardia sp. C8 TaxID=2762759 RepID=UPI001642F41D|nr:helix-turn-helix transcriptional regulator [Pseudonocardia sp. C8]MBC3190921.1 helix-turn-helix transcriptional regulator [Pseudonocardia sp. C8]